MKKHETERRPLRTELIFILDRSGSMGGLESDTIGGYNALLEKQKREPGECHLTTILFDDRYEVLCDRVPLRQARPLTEDAYYVRGSTALLDAVGRAITTAGNAQKYAFPDQRADRVMVVITTDGMENASREYTLAQVRGMIERQKSRFGWEFLFLGANIDAVGTAAGLGIAPSRAANYHADSEGTRLNYKVVSDAVSCLRKGAPLAESWKEDIDRDFACRRSRR